MPFFKKKQPSEEMANNPQTADAGWACWNVLDIHKNPNPGFLWVGGGGVRRWGGGGGGGGGGQEPS